MPDVFPLKCDNDRYLQNLECYRTTPPPRPMFLEVMFLRLTGNYTSVPGFVIVLVDVPPSCRLLIGICPFEVLYILQIAGSVKLSLLVLAC